MDNQLSGQGKNKELPASIRTTVSLKKRAILGGLIVRRKEPEETGSESMSVIAIIVNYRLICRPANNSQMRPKSRATATTQATSAMSPPQTKPPPPAKPSSRYSVKGSPYRKKQSAHVTGRRKWRVLATMKIRPIAVNAMVYVCWLFSGAVRRSVRHSLDHISHSQRFEARVTGKKMYAVRK